MCLLVRFICLELTVRRGHRSFNQIKCQNMTDFCHVLTLDDDGEAVYKAGFLPVWTEGKGSAGLQEETVCR